MNYKYNYIIMNYPDVNTLSMLQIYGLFSLKPPINALQLSEAKKLVLNLHPDKNLTRDTKDDFVYYMKAYKIMEAHAMSNGMVQKSTSIEEKKMVYDPSRLDREYSTEMVKAIQKNFNNDEFIKATEERTRKFSENEIKEARLWWTAPIEEPIPARKSAKFSNEEFDKMKREYFAGRQVSVHRVVKEIVPMGMMGSSLYDEDEDVTDYDKRAYYSTMDVDPFAKLPYEDIRKVYRDQIFIDHGTEETARKSYKSEAEYKNARERDLGNIKYESKEVYEQQFRQQEELEKRRNDEKRMRLEDKLRRDQAENETFLGRLARLTNG